MKKVFFLKVIVIIALVLLAATEVYADRGTFVMRPVEMVENIDVFDAGQKAIICWNDGEEILVLSTDKYASADAKVLEFLPLPSKPSKVEESDTSLFRNIAVMITEHRPKVVYSTHNGREGKVSGRGAEKLPAPVEIVFHEKIGAHDITIAKVNDISGFTGWVKKFLEKENLPYREQDVKMLKPVVSDYLDRGYRFFVFDVIELGKEKKSISPILYRFKSNSVFFPLVVTTLSEGITDINLYMFTPFKTDIWGTRTGMASGFYTMHGEADYNFPIKFEVQNEEVSRISNILGTFLGNCDRIWFSTARYKGPTKNLKKDFILAPTNWAIR